MGVLLDASTEGKASNLVAARTQRVRCVAIDTGLSMLVRPDACVAWAGDRRTEQTAWMKGSVAGPATPDRFFQKNGQQVNETSHRMSIVRGA